MRRAADAASHAVGDCDVETGIERERHTCFGIIAVTIKVEVAEVGFVLIVADNYVAFAVADGAVGPINIGAVVGIEEIALRRELEKLDTQRHVRVNWPFVVENMVEIVSH